ncbi:hypothetical protein [Verrucomicrobium spinosum]|uniref:hypothetical protein n=1 Tax=Verrucomicrobium spinosum TaxID=2736 RepID=UPI00094664C7|nr:hypothetical protein [Verrucomicrobium spinosum]
MSHPRYFLPDHPALTEVYSKADLRAMLQSGELSRSEIVVDDETGLGHLLGDLLAAPYPDVTGTPMLTTTGSRPRPPLKQEFRADTPLTRSLPPENVRLHKDADDRDDDDEGDDGFDDELPLRTVRRTKMTLMSGISFPTPDRSAGRPRLNRCPIARPVWMTSRRTFS